MSTVQDAYMKTNDLCVLLAGWYAGHSLMPECSSYPAEHLQYCIPNPDPRKLAPPCLGQLCPQMIGGSGGRSTAC